MGMKPWCGIGMGTTMTPYSGYEYGGVAGLEDSGEMGDGGIAIFPCTNGGVEWPEM